MSTSRRPIVLVLALLTLQMTVGAAPAAAAAPETATIALTGEPVGVVEVAEGGRVTFHAETGDHDIVADNDGWSTGLLEEGEQAVLQFNRAGDYAFHCTLHDNVTGTIRVVPPGDAPDAGDGDSDTGEDVPPQARFLSPRDGATVSEPVLVRIAVEDPDGNTGPVDVAVRVDGGTWWAATPEGDAWTWRWDVTRVASGPHTLEARAVGESATGPLAEIRVHVEHATDDEPDDRDADADAPPTVAFTSPVDGSVLTASLDVLVTGTASASGDRDVQYVEVAVDGGDWRLADGTRSWTFPWRTGEAPGTHTLEARAWDGERYSDVATIHVEVDADGGSFDDAAPVDDRNGRPGAGVTTSWQETVLNVGWAAIGLAALAVAWTWASSRS